MKQFLRNLILGDWLLKVFSLTLALLTWLAVTDSLKQKTVEAPDKPDLWHAPYNDVPITLISANGDVSDYRVKPAEVDTIILEGTREALQGIERRHIRVLVDLSNFSSTNGFKRRVNVLPPPGTACIKVDPEEVEIIPPIASEPATKPSQPQ